MNAELFSATVLLILVIDPFGNVPLVVSALKNVSPERHVRVVLRECAAAASSTSGHGAWRGNRGQWRGGRLNGLSGELREQDYPIARGRVRSQKRLRAGAPTRIIRA